MIAFDEAELSLLESALVHYSPPGRAAEVLKLLGRIVEERRRVKIIAEELGPPTGRLVSIPGGLDTAPRKR